MESLKVCLYTCSSSVPKALSALADWDSDDEDHESTPVITTTNGNENGSKPTAPLDTSEEKGKTFKLEKLYDQNLSLDGIRAVELKKF